MAADTSGIGLRPYAERVPRATVPLAVRGHQALALAAALAAAGCANAPPAQVKRPLMGYPMPVGLQQVRDDLGGIYFAPCNPCLEPSPKTPVLGSGAAPETVANAAPTEVAATTDKATDPEAPVAAKEQPVSDVASTPPTLATLPLQPRSPPEAAGERAAEAANESVPTRPPRLAADTRPNQWEVMASDVSLPRLFARWASQAGYRLQWDVDRAFQFLITEPGTYTGTFEGAVRQALYTPGIRLSDHPLEACAYPQSPPLVRVTHQGEQAPGCMVAWPTDVSASRWPDFGL
jgi:hypothetical protein